MNLLCLGIFLLFAGPAVAMEEGTEMKIRTPLTLRPATVGENHDRTKDIKEMGATASPGLSLEVLRRFDMNNPDTIIDEEGHCKKLPKSLAENSSLWQKNRQEAKKARRAGLEKVLHGNLCEQGKAPRPFTCFIKTEDDSKSYCWNIAQAAGGALEEKYEYISIKNGKITFNSSLADDNDVMNLLLTRSNLFDALDKTQTDVR